MPRIEGSEFPGWMPQDAQGNWDKDYHRFMSKVVVTPNASRGVPPALGPCWCWNGSIQVPGCYATYAARQDDGRLKMKLAHRFLYEKKYGPLEGKRLYNLCDCPYCVNYKHWEVRTDGVRRTRWAGPAAAHPVIQERNDRVREHLPREMATRYVQRVPTGPEPLD